MSTGNTPITSFSGRYHFLSNFHPAKIRFEGAEYPTVEHAYQAAKTDAPSARERIAKAATPGYAKAMGRAVRKLAPDWENRKEVIMLELLREKFSTERLKRLLMNTGTAKLIEGNNWGDRYWGVCRGEGENRLGVLLMQIRDEIRSRHDPARPAQSAVTR